jgi:hypothetical protein
LGCVTPSRNHPCLRRPPTCAPIEASTRQHPAGRGADATLAAATRAELPPARSQPALSQRLPTTVAPPLPRDDLRRAAAVPAAKIPTRARAVCVCTRTSSACAFTRAIISFGLPAAGGQQAGGRVSVGRRAAGTIQPRATRARAPPPRRVEAGGSSAATGSREAGGAGQTAPPDWPRGRPPTFCLPGRPGGFAYP